MQKNACNFPPFRNECMQNEMNRMLRFFCCQYVQRASIVSGQRKCDNESHILMSATAVSQESTRVLVRALPTPADARYSIKYHHITKMEIVFHLFCARHEKIMIDNHLQIIIVDTIILHFHQTVYRDAAFACFFSSILALYIL